MKLGNIQKNHSDDLFLYTACPPVGQKNFPEPVCVCVSVLVRGCVCVCMCSGAHLVTTLLHAPVEVSGPLSLSFTLKYLSIALLTFLTFSHTYHSYKRLILRLFKNRYLVLT